ncbi:hypothetical protein GCM10018966_001890 [Streptomyces yanii]
MLGEFREVAEGLSYRRPEIPIVSTMTGAVATAEELCDPGYWVSHVRRPVRFHDAVLRLVDEGATTFLELGPGGALTALCTDALQDRPDLHFTPLTRRDRPEPSGALTAVGALYVRGVPVDWPALLGRGGTPIDLPTYAFQHRRYWLDTVPATDAAGLGQLAAGHPVLGAVVALPGADTVVLTGRLSARSQPWLTDHVVRGEILLPGTGFVELAVRAGDQVGCGTVEELTLEAPLALSASGGVALQVVVGPAQRGRRSLAVYARPDDAPAEQEWTRHAAGVLAEESRPESFDLAHWPPADAEPIDLEGAYSTLRERGYDYGPAFRALRAAWRRGDEVFAEIEADETTARTATSYGLHPALLDAAMHADLLTDPDGATLLPFVWNGVTLYAAGATELRVRITRVSGGRGLRDRDRGPRRQGRRRRRVPGLAAGRRTAARPDRRRRLRRLPPPGRVAPPARHRHRNGGHPDGARRGMGCDRQRSCREGGGTGVAGVRRPSPPRPGAARPRGLRRARRRRRGGHTSTGHRGPRLPDTRWGRPRRRPRPGPGPYRRRPSYGAGVAGRRPLRRRSPGGADPGRRVPRGCPRPGLDPGVGAAARRPGRAPGDGSSLWTRRTRSLRRSWPPWRRANRRHPSAVPPSGYRGWPVSRQRPGPRPPRSPPKEPCWSRVAPAVSAVWWHATW